jgi:fatty-acyl-CoA synthase
VRPTTLERVLIGGSACPRSLITALENDYGVEVLHAWGMTETSPLATVSRMKRKHERLGPDERTALKVKQGRPVFGVELEIVGPRGDPLPHDGEAFGDLEVRGPWVCASYFKDEGGDALVDGWFPTGDVASIDADGYVKITDRSKDGIKSGGEWISSIELENLAVAHPAIREAAVIAVAHAKWGERPLVIAVRKPGATVGRAELLDFYKGKVARWWIPDDVVFVDELPHTATGKLLKTRLREEYGEYVLPG